mmetsp:Transcript_52200/g.77949  ORF Transcript_52200/g.77949 Transcript_52200/m.77949 type:complete len:129 (-) Transcript_52200:611-997(-)
MRDRHACAGRDKKQVRGWALVRHARRSSLPGHDHENSTGSHSTTIPHLARAASRQRSLVINQTDLLAVLHSEDVPQEELAAVFYKMSETKSPVVSHCCHSKFFLGLQCHDLATQEHLTPFVRFSKRYP